MLQDYWEMLKDHWEMLQDQYNYRVVKSQQVGYSMNDTAVTERGTKGDEGMLKTSTQSLSYSMD